MTPEALITKLHNVKKTASGWQAQCPAHDDKSPSLTVTPNCTRILLHCHAGCLPESIVRAMGLRLSDLFMDEPKLRRIEYRYTDENSNHLYSVHRTDGPEGKRVWQQAAQGKALADVKHYPYRLPEVLAAIQEGSVILICEGEKCVDHAREKFNVVCTTNSGGAGKWTAKHSAFFAGAQVCVLPDNDEPGRAHARQVVESLRGIATAKIVELPGLPDKGDICDWKGTREDLEGLICKPVQQAVFIPSWSNRPADTRALIELSNTRILSPGNIAMLTAGAGSGKSSVLEAMCSAALNPMADTLGLIVNATSVLYIDTERSIGDHHTSWRRFMQRAGFAEGTACPESVRWENIRAIDSISDRHDHLFKGIDCDACPEVVLIDGIGDFVADPNDSEECTGLVARLCSTVHRRNTALLLTLHVNPALNATKARGVLGSELWRKAESVLIIERLDDSVRRLTTDFNLGKNRSGSDSIAHSFKWCDEAKMHVSCDAPSGQKPKVKMERETVIEKMGDSAWSYAGLKTMIMSECSKSAPTAKRWISELLELKLLVKSDSGEYTAKSAREIRNWVQD